MTPAERLAALTDRTGGPDACWPVRFASHPDRYGRMTVGGRQVYAHRLAYQLANGPIPDGLLVCHACDNPPCVNPAHLWLGTNADNLRDMRLKDRGARARLNANQIAIARSGLFSLGSLAEHWDVSTRTIYRALRSSYRPAREVSA